MKLTQNDYIEVEAEEVVNEKSKSKQGAYIWLALAIVYLISPIDLVPDFIPILGWLDDVAVVVAALNNLRKQF